MEKICKNKKCQRPLPDGYNHKHCENCRNEHINQVKIVGKVVFGLAAIIGSTVITIASKKKN